MLPVAATGPTISMAPPAALVAMGCRPLVGGRSRRGGEGPAASGLLLALAAGAAAAALCGLSHPAQGNVGRQRMAFVFPTVAPASASPAARPAAAPLSATALPAVPQGAEWALRVVAGAVLVAAACRRGGRSGGLVDGTAAAGHLGGTLLPLASDEGFHELSRVVMFGVKRRPHKLIHLRTYTDWARGRRHSSAAKARFLVREDGSIWRRQAGLRHLKSKKSPERRKRLKKMVRITKREYKRVQATLGRRPPPLRWQDLIMRKFNQARLKKHLGMTDRHVGTAMWT